MRKALLQIKKKDAFATDTVLRALTCIRAQIPSLLAFWLTLQLWIWMSGSKGQAGKLRQWDEHGMHAVPTGSSGAHNLGK